MLTQKWHPWLYSGPEDITHSLHDSSTTELGKICLIWARISILTIFAYCSELKQHLTSIVPVRWILEDLALHFNSCKLGTEYSNICNTQTQVLILYCATFENRLPDHSAVGVHPLSICCPTNESLWVTRRIHHLRHRTWTLFISS